MHGVGNRADLDPLLQECIELAQRLLEKNGEFFPFGVVLGAHGGVTHVEGWTGEEQPPSKDVIELLRAGFKLGAAAGEYRATALAADVRLRGRDTDAIRVTLEHRDGTAIHCFLPYKKTADGWEFGEVFATAAERGIFVPVEG